MTTVTSLDFCAKQVWGKTKLPRQTHFPTEQPLPSLAPQTRLLCQVPNSFVSHS